MFSEFFVLNYSDKGTTMSEIEKFTERVEEFIKLPQDSRSSIITGFTKLMAAALGAADNISDESVMNSIIQETDLTPEAIQDYLRLCDSLLSSVSKVCQEEDIDFDYGSKVVAANLGFREPLQSTLAQTLYELAVNVARCDEDDFEGAFAKQLGIAWLKRASCFPVTIPGLSKEKIEAGSSPTLTRLHELTPFGVINLEVEDQIRTHPVVFLVTIHNVRGLIRLLQELENTLAEIRTLNNQIKTMADGHSTD